MAEEPTLRQRILARISHVASTLEEIGHLPGDRLLAIDVSMTPDEHTEWLRRLMRDALAEEPATDGEAFFDDLRAQFAANAERERQEGTIRGSGTATDIAERINHLPEGQYRFSIERLPSKQEVVEKVDALFAKSRNAAQPEFVGKTEDEIQAIANTWVDEARAEIKAERLQILRRIAYAQRGGFLSEDEFFLLAYELILSRFGADH